MCGIYGCFNYHEANFSEQDLRKMGSILRSRGPDGHGVYIDKSLMMGHNRLSIIDLSEKGTQPMSNKDGSIVISFNGEIYNHIKLKESLSREHQFQSESDTEVIIHAYEELGEELWDKLQGMFAFALWDRNKDTFYLVRDHYGIKPLYYSFQNEALLFSSQIKAISLLDFFNVEYNYQSLWNYFSYFYVPGPDTIVDGIFSLKPGSFFKLTGNSHSIQEYTNLNQGRKVSSENEKLQKDVQFNLSNAVKNSIISDVPVGIFLSGGLDSSILLAEMSSIYKEKIKTFTLGTEEKSYNEASFAEETADYYNTEHYTENLKIVCFDSLVTEIVTAVDNINANPGLLQKFQFTKIAKNNVKVALLGSGGDELFAGYLTYKANMYYKYLVKVPKFIRYIILKVIDIFPVSYKNYSISYLLKRLIEGSFYEKEKAHYWWRVIFNDDEKFSMLNLGNKDNIVLDSSYKYLEHFNAASGSFEEKALVSDFKLFLGDNDLILADHLGMHFSLEIRPPFLHQEFVRFAMNVPYKSKVNKGQLKYLLKNTYKNVLPENILKRSKKGVVAPLGLLFKGKLKNYLVDLFSESNIRNYPILNFHFINTLLVNHLSGKEDNGYKIWSIIIFLKWHDLYFNKNYVIN